MGALELDREVREHAERYLAGEMSRDAFEEWLVANTWDVRTYLAISLDHLLAEFVTRDAFDEELRSLLNTTWVDEGSYRTSSALVTREADALVVRRTTTIRGHLAYAGT